MLLTVLINSCYNKEKVEKVIEFAERIKKVQEKVETVLRKVQEEIKWQANRERIEVEE